MGAAILRPRRFIVTRVERSLFAVADRTDARGVDAEGLQVFLGDVRALVAEGEVVLLGAALVAMAFDEDVVRAAVGAVQPLRGILQCALSVRRERGLVVSEKCI